jgi:fructose transport system permease protein
MVLSAVVMGQFTFRYGIPVPISILCGLACGALCGFVNGWLVAKMKLPPFIVTLGTWQVYNATKYLYSANETIRGQDIEAQAPLLQLFGLQIKFGGAVITLGVIFMVLLVVFLWYVLNYRPDWLRIAHQRRVFQHRVHHRRGDRRHFALRRARLHPGHDLRRPHCRCLLPGSSPSRN